LLEPDLIQEISLEIGIDAAFIEKDWFAVQLIKAIEDYNKQQSIQAIFSGGTSLSKGYGAIKRFSEDLDFFLSVDNNQELSQGQRRNFRRNLISHITNSNECFEIDDEHVERGDSYRFFKAPVVYPKSFDKIALRPHLQLEMTFCEPRLQPIRCPIRSIISIFLKQEPEAEINCVSPIETVADKLSALTWRVVVRDRSAAKDDPTIIRHLHDLAALKTNIADNVENFKTTAKSSLESDRNRRGGELIQELSDSDRIQKALEQLKTDPIYQKEYRDFVLAMSYADDDERLLFDEAINSLENIANIYLTSN